MLVVFEVIGYYISGMFLYPDVNMSNYQEVLVDIFMHPMKNYWNEKTRGCLYLAAFGWMGLIIHYQYYHRNFVLGREHGSAEWAGPKQVMATKGDKQGRILSQHITISKSGKKIANNNMIVVGAPGTGKSFRIVAPNLLRNDASVVVLDVKGDLLRNYGKAMEKNGYQIKCLDVISSDFGKSHMYNPFVYIKTEVDLIRLVTNIQTSLTPQDASKGEPFWEDGVTMYLLACFYYVWLEMEEPTLPKVQLLMNEESRVLDEETGETELEKRMNTLVVRSPMGNEHPAVSNYRKLKEAGIGTYILFQETYNKESYEALHPTGPKSDYAYHTEAMDRAMEGGIDDVGLGVLFGLDKYKYEFAGLLMHAEHLEAVHGVGPHTISVPRIKHADDIDPDVFDNGISDDTFAKICALIRISVPYTGMIISTRESQAVREKVLPLGVSQISGASKTSVGGYADPEAEKNAEATSEQFDVSDQRTLDEVVNWLIKMDYIPSFCTACYREGRTGDRFMALCKSMQILNCCHPNALMTLKEYLEDYASPQTRELGMKLIDREIENITNPKVKQTCYEHIHDIADGKRDFRF